MPRFRTALTQDNRKCTSIYSFPGNALRVHSSSGVMAYVCATKERWGEAVTWWGARVSVQAIEERITHARFDILATANTMSAFWNIALCRLVEVDQLFRGAYRLCHRGNEWQASFLKTRYFFFLRGYMKEQVFVRNLLHRMAAMRVSEVQLLLKHPRSWRTHGSKN